VCVCVREGEREVFCLIMLSVAEIMYCWWQENEIQVWNTGRMIQTGENRSAVRKTCPSANLSTTDPIWTDL
jgi:hypothetical protein